MESQYNLRSPAVKRLMKEAKELHDPTEQYFAQPLEDNLFEWHFTVRGPAETDFDSGCYHGRIVLPPEYPMKPPSILLLTPNGRFEVGKKICLSISGHHPETWQPSWSIRTVLLAIIGFMPTQGGGAIGSLDYTPAERKVLAKKSQSWTCESCGYCNKDSLKEPSDKESTESLQANQEAKDLAAQISFKGEAAKNASAQAAPTPASWPGPPPGVQEPLFPGMTGTIPNSYPSYTMAQPTGIPSMGTEPVSPTQGVDQGLSTDGGPPEQSPSAEQERTEDTSISNTSNTSELRQRITSPTTGSTTTTQAVTNTQTRQANSGTFTLIMIWLVACLLVILGLRRLYVDML